MMPSTAMPKRGCLSQVVRVLKGFFVLWVALVLLGVGYQALATASDNGAYSPGGIVVTVGGRQMHVRCLGEGSPTVILEAGGGAESLWWVRVQQHVSLHTRVCAYDRAGHGWSEPASGSRDPAAIVSELHSLLQSTQVPAPYIMVGHSFGALWARIAAAQLPDQVVGLVLVDSTFLVPDHFASQSEFDAWKSSNDALKAVEWALYRVGLVRLTAPADFQRSGYPAVVIPEMVALRSRSQTFDVDYAEQVAARRQLTDASNAAKNLGALPTFVLWAGQSPTVQPFFAPMREEMLTYSSNIVSKIVEGADHGSILGSEQYSRDVADAVLRVIAAARTGERLTP